MFSLIFQRISLVTTRHKVFGVKNISVKNIQNYIRAALLSKQQRLHTKGQSKTLTYFKNPFKTLMTNP